MICRHFHIFTRHLPETRISDFLASSLETGSECTGDISHGFKWTPCNSNFLKGLVIIVERGATSQVLSLRKERRRGGNVLAMLKGWGTTGFVVLLTWELEDVAILKGKGVL